MPAALATTPSRARNDAASSSATADRDAAMAPQTTAATPQEGAECDHPEGCNGQCAQGDRHGGQPPTMLLSNLVAVDGGTQAGDGDGWWM